MYRFVQEEDPEASVHNLESLEHFMSIKIGSIDGMVGIDGSHDAGLNTALGYWKDFHRSVGGDESMERFPVTQ